jgi:hypothetical protein
MTKQSMRAYSYELRQRILSAVDQGKSRAEIIKTFDVSRATIKRYLKLRRETGDVKPKAIPGRPAKKGAALLHTCSEVPRRMWFVTSGECARASMMRFQRDEVCEVQDRGGGKCCGQGNLRSVLLARNTFLHLINTRPLAGCRKKGVTRGNGRGTRHRDMPLLVGHNALAQVPEQMLYCSGTVVRLQTAAGSVRDGSDPSDHPG